MRKILITVILGVVISTAATSQIQSKIAGEGSIVAFQKHERHRVKPYSGKGMATPVEIWIVRIDHWKDGDKRAGYFLVNYTALYQRVLSDKEINQGVWRFMFRDPIFHEAESCAGSVPVPAKDGASYEWRRAKMNDFERTLSGRSDIIPELKSLPCLIAEKSPLRVSSSLSHKGD
jgi:hypothetical protein